VDGLARHLEATQPSPLGNRLEGSVSSEIVPYGEEPEPRAVEDSLVDEREAARVSPFLMLAVMVPAILLYSLIGYAVYVIARLALG
jgi:hypothetical protein